MKTMGDKAMLNEAQISSLINVILMTKSGMVTKKRDDIPYIKHS